MAINFVKRLFEDGLEFAARGSRSLSRFSQAHGDDMERLFQRQGSALSNIESADDIRAFVQNNPRLGADFKQSLLKNADELAPVFKRHNDTVGVMNDYATKRNPGESMEDFLSREHAAGNMDNMDPDAWSNMVENADDYQRLALRESANAGARGAVRVAGETVRDGFNMAFRRQKGFVTRGTDGRMQEISMADGRALINAGMGQDLIKVHKFSRAKIAAVGAGTVVANGLTDGAISDAGVAIVSGSASPVAWVLRTGGEGIVDAFGSVFGEGGPDSIDTQWVTNTAGYDMERDGKFLLVQGETDVPTAQEYADRYEALQGEASAEEMAEFMSPERYAQLYPAFKASYDADVASRPESDMDRVIGEASDSVNGAVNGATAAASGAAATAGAAADDAGNALSGMLGGLGDKLSGIFNSNASGPMVFAAAGAAIGLATGGIGSAVGFAVLGGVLGMMFPNALSSVKNVFNNSANPEAEQAPAATAAADPAAVGTSASGSDMSQQYASAQAGVAATGQDNDAVTPAEQDLRNNGQEIGAGTSPAPQEQVEVVQRQPAFAAPAPL